MARNQNFQLRSNFRTFITNLNPSELKKLYLPVVVAFIVAGFCMVSNSKNITRHPHKTEIGEGMGADEDAAGREEYELNMLRDPATGKIPDHIREKELAFAKTLPNDGSLSGARTTGSALVFQARGPWNVGGRTRALGIDVSNENNLLAGTPSGGMWRSTDQGNTWQLTTPINSYQGASCLVQDTRPGHTNVWYYGSGEGYGASASATGAYYLGNGIFKSTDSGATWSVLPATAPASPTSFTSWGEVAWNIVTNPTDTTHDAVYVAAYGAIYKSLDGGTTWNAVLGTFGTSYFTDIAISKKGVIYATLSSDGAPRGIYRSVDGITFTNIIPATFPANYNRVKIGISPANQEQVYFLGNTPGFGMPDTNYVGTVEWNSLWKYTYLSGDGTGTGGTWTDLSANIPMTGGIFNKFTCQGSYDLVVKVKPNDTNTVFIGGTNVYRSTSAFADTTHTTYIGGYVPGASLPVVLDYPSHHPDQHDLAFFPSNPNKMVSSNDGGVFLTNDNTAANVSWASLDNGYISTMFYSCAIDHATTSDVIIGGAQDNGSWYTNNTTLTSPWVTPRGGDGSFCSIADNQAAFYFSIQNGNMMKAKLNSAGGIDSFARIDPIGGRNYQFVNPFTIDPNNNNLMYLAAGTHLWRNNDLSGIPYAGNWDSITTNWVQFPDSMYAGDYITSVSASKVPANRVYIGTNSHFAYRVDNANTGTPTPVNITSTTSSALFPGGANISCIAIDPTNADNIMVVFSNYGVYSLFYSTNGGTSYTKVGGNLEDNVAGTGNGPSCRWASIIPVADGMVYLVGTSVGLFGTTQLNGTSTVWTQLGTNSIGSSIVDMIDYRTNDGLVVVATHGHGLFSTHITQVANVDGIKNIAATGSNLNLSTYPNPFARQATISFTLAQKSHVTITLLSETGRLVKQLADEVMNPGTQKIPFESDNLPSGIYYCTVNTGLFSETKKMVLIR